MIQRVYERARLARGVEDVVIATDDHRVQEAVRAFGGKVEMTDPAIPSGTDRVAEIARLPQYRSFNAFVNVQGDEPFIEPRAIEAAA